MTVGARVRRHEDDRLLRGRGRFVDDVDRSAQVHVRLVRSTLAHARLTGIDTAEAAAVPGVVAVITAEDLAAIPAIPERIALRDQDLSPYLQPVLAGALVRYVGEPVAAVVAEDPYTAEDAADLVAVGYEELPVVLDADEADAAAELELGYGQVDAAFTEAEHVVALTLEVGRHAAVPMEPRGLVAEYDAGTDRLEVWGATKVPNFTRELLARMLRMPDNRIRMRAMDAGGGFGARGEFYPEDLIVPWLARRLRRPVKWTEDRAEHLVAVNHSRQQRHRIEAAFAADGRLLALRDDVAHDNGAYIRTHGVLVPELTLAMLPGPYRVPAYQGRIRVGLTNKTPCGTYRAPGRYEGTFAREQLFDVAADRIGIDRVDLRRANLLGPDEMPHVRRLNTLGTDVVLDAGDYPALLDTALEQAGPWRAEAERMRARGRRVGFGLAVFLEKSGLGPDDTADVLVHPSGEVVVHSGGTSLGQGIETVLAQIAAAELGVDDARVEVVNGDTELQPFGTGSWASRSTVVAGSAVHRAAGDVLARARELAARVLEADPEDLVFAEGRFTVRGEPSAAVTLAEAAAASRPSSPHLREGEPPGLAARRGFNVAHMTYPYGVHAALIEVDPRTGGVTPLRYLVAYEVGRAINPTLVEGQLVGGVAQGLGGALHEQFRYDEAGQPQAATFMDYLIPTAAETPPEVTTIIAEDAPSPGNPLGAKGAGEGGITAVGATIASAVRDALDMTADVAALPLTPDRITRLARQAGCGG